MEVNEVYYTVKEYDKRVIRVIISEIVDQEDRIFDLMVNKMNTGGFEPYTVIHVDHDEEHCAINIDFERNGVDEIYRISPLGTVRQILNENHIY